MLGIRTKQGFTIIELLVVIAIIGVLVGILTPAIQQVREAVKRSECQNRLRQFGIAMQNFESARGVFPPGQLAPSYHEIENGDGFAYHQLIGHLGYALPYLEQSQLQNAFGGLNWDVNSTGPPWCNDPELWNTAGGVCSIFRCPSDQEEDPLLVITASASFYFSFKYCEPGYRGWTNYLGCSGDVLIAGQYHYEKGIFYSRSKIGYKDISDGSTNTILMGEAIGGTSNYEGEVMGNARKRYSVMGNGIGSNFGYFEGIESDSSEDESLFCFSSRHAGQIANFCLADGSVRPIPRSIALDILSELMTRSGGESNSQF